MDPRPASPPIVRIDGEPVRYSIAEDLQRTIDAFRVALSPMAAALQEMGRRLSRLGVVFRERANSPAYVAGLEARYSARAGLDPAYATSDALDGLVRVLLATGTTPEDDDLLAPFLTEANRRRLAVAALRGWVHSYVTKEVLTAAPGWVPCS